MGLNYCCLTLLQGKRDSPFLDQTVMKAVDKQDKFLTQTDEVITPLTVYSEHNGKFSCHGKTKNKNHTD